MNTDMYPQDTETPVQAKQHEGPRKTREKHRRPWILRDPPKVDHLAAGGRRPGGRTRGGRAPRGADPHRQNEDARDLPDEGTEESHVRRRYIARTAASSPPWPSTEEPVWASDLGLQAS